MQIDYSYSDAKLNKLKNRYLDAEEEEFRARKLRRLLLAAEREFNQIIEDLVVKVREQVDVILNDPEVYYEYLEIKDTDKIYLLFKKLLESELIREEGE